LPQADESKIDLSLSESMHYAQDIPGWLVASEGGLTVALDITITDELKKEGLSRDVVNRIQNLRKDKGLEVQDKIAIAYFTKDPTMNEALRDFSTYIKTETQAFSLESKQMKSAEKFDIDGIELEVHIEVVSV
jgi:isoleucyl-tRNA synthetase